MSERESDQLEQLVEAVRGATKYRSVSHDLMRSVVSTELAKRRSLKEAIKATKNKLHQVGGAYLDGEVRYERWLDELRQACLSGDKERIRGACISIMRHHASTRERVPVLDEFYTTVLAGMPPIRSILDIACGLHPLAIPWMPLAQDAEYHAYDIYQDMTAFLHEYLRLMH